MGFLDLIILIEEFGRALVPGPFIPTAVGGAIALLEGGSDAQKQQYLPKIASGEQIWTLAFTHPAAHVSDYMTVVARTKKGQNAEEGVTLFIVDGKSPGISHTVLKTIASDKQCEVKLENVKV